MKCYVHESGTLISFKDIRSNTSDKTFSDLRLNKMWVFNYFAIGIQSQRISALN